MTINVLIDRSTVSIDTAVFKALLDNSVAGTYAAFPRALESGELQYKELRLLSQKGEIPLPLFFAPLPLVETQVRLKTQKLLAGISKATFAIGSRAKVELRDVELIVKDLIRKQEELKKHDSTLTRNPIVGALGKRIESPEAAAATLMSAIGLRAESIRRCRKKADALELMIEHLERHQVLVSRSVQHYMPQRLTHVHFSGMTIRDSKVPYIFLAGGDHGDQQESEGRTNFTLALMTVLVARRIFAPMTWDANSAEAGLGVEYDIAGAMLMPRDQLRKERLATLDDVKDASDEFKVTPSAVTVRAMRLGLIGRDIAKSYLDRLREEFASRPKRDDPRSPIRPENAVRKYSGRELAKRMLRSLDAGTLSAGDFCRIVCLNHLRPEHLGDLRKAVA